MSLRTLLIHPTSVGVYGKMQPPMIPPLGLAYIGAVLEKAGHPVSIIDVDSVRFDDDRILQYAIEYKPDLVGFSCVTPTFNRAHNLALRIKQALPKVRTVFGGIHPTVSPREVAGMEGIDTVVKGEGEETAIELWEALEGKRPLDSVAGILWSENGEIRETALRLLLPELDLLPFPGWHLFLKLRYRYPDALRQPVFQMMTSRGCPAMCTYCQTKNIFTRRFRARSALSVVNEIDWLVHHWGAKEIHIQDDVFTTNKKRVFEIRDELHRRGISVPLNLPNGLRADYVNEDIMRALKDMGFYSVAFGIESGNQRILDIVEKGESLDAVRKAVAAARKAELEVWGFFMLGLPEETAATMQDTINFAIDLDVDVAKFHILQPYPGSKIFYQLDELGLVTNKDYDNYGIHTRPVHRLRDLSEDDILAWQKRAYRSFYFRPRKLLQHLGRMKSWVRLVGNVGFGWNLMKEIFIGGHTRPLGEFDTPMPPKWSVAHDPEKKKDWKDVAERMEKVWHEKHEAEIERLERTFTQGRRDSLREKRAAAAAN